LGIERVSFPEELSFGHPAFLGWPQWKSPGQLPLPAEAPAAGTKKLLDALLDGEESPTDRIHLK
jgi:hypothetical protein